MVYRALNIGVLGAMAKGEAEYNAEAAQKAADNLVASANLDASMLWPQGSDNSANPASTADAKAWTPEAAVGEKDEAFVTAANAMQGAAGGGLDALKGAMVRLANPAAVATRSRASRQLKGRFAFLPWGRDNPAPCREGRPCAGS